ncbi:hypothetical protein ACH4VM_26615 [Streptomyces sp. NPDC020792]|uniref:hypothetical protein n=1 Tax=Streptomyces sp. NPDC020792 TaxID=3365089 RepID=UPI00378BCC6B
MRARVELVAALAVLVCAGCGGSGDEGMTPEESQAAEASRAAELAEAIKVPETAEPTEASESAAVSEEPDPEEDVQEPDEVPEKLFPGRSVKVHNGSMVANRGAWGKGWPWKSSDVVMACSDAINGGAYLNAADGENYLLTGTITQPGFVKGNAGVLLWDMRDEQAYGEWLDAGAKLCPAG